ALSETALAAQLHGGNSTPFDRGAKRLCRTRYTTALREYGPRCEDGCVLTVREGFYDEMLDADGTPRPHAQTLVHALEQLRPEAPYAAGRRRDAIFMQQGITFDAAGPDADGPVRDRPFPLDLVPRIIPAAEWTSLKRGLAQRIRALNAFIDDVYHAREIVHDGLVPWQLIVSRS